MVPGSPSLRRDAAHDLAEERDAGREVRRRVAVGGGLLALLFDRGLRHHGGADPALDLLDEHAPGVLGGRLGGDAVRELHGQPGQARVVGGARVGGVRAHVQALRPEVARPTAAASPGRRCSPSRRRRCPSGGAAPGTAAGRGRCRTGRTSPRHRAPPGARARRASRRPRRSRRPRPRRWPAGRPRPPAARARPRRRRSSSGAGAGCWGAPSASSRWTVGPDQARRPPRCRRGAGARARSSGPRSPWARRSAGAVVAPERPESRDGRPVRPAVDAPPDARPQSLTLEQDRAPSGRRRLVRGWTNGQDGLPDRATPA